jgi:hypothetical protein
MMKRFLNLGLLGTSALFGAQQAYAAPIMSLTLQTAGGTPSECSAGAISGTASFSGTTCTITGTAGLVGFLGTYGSFNDNDQVGEGNGTNPSSQSQPALWLNSNESTTTAGTESITLEVTGYTIPTGAFPLQTLVSGTVDSNLSTSVADFFDPNNTGTAGAGTQLYSTTWSGPANGSAPGSGVIIDVSNTNGTYGESWLETVTSTATGTDETSGVNGTLDTPVPVPTPSPLALLGLGLTVLYGVSGLRRFVPRA